MPWLHGISAPQGNVGSPQGKVWWPFMVKSSLLHMLLGFSSLCIQILRVLRDYDCRNTLLLPPRAPGEKLPPEVLEYYQDQKRLQDEQAESRTGDPAGQDNGETVLNVSHPQRLSELFSE